MYKLAKKETEQLSRFLRDVENYLTMTQDARADCERDRDYKDGKQWTESQTAKLRARGQAPIVSNRIKSKHAGLVGLLDLRRSDPKAYPRTKKHAKAAEAITDALRYIADDNDYNGTCRLEMADDFFCEGTCGALIDVKKKGKKTDIKITQIPWDRIYYDPFSRRLDFSDARYKGLMTWMDFDQFKVLFPKVEINFSASSTATDETFEDRPRWVDSDRQRIRVAMHYYLEGEVWKVAYFTDQTFLIEPEVSDYLDDNGEPSCPIELASAHIDRDNNRYGEVRGFISQQDEINHRRSKALHLLSQRQTFGRKGSAKDIAALKRELSKPDGHVEFIGEKFGSDFGVLPTGDMAQGQLELYQDAKAELDSVSFNAQLSGDRQSGDLSGKAIDRLQQAGTIELNSQYTIFSNLEKRIYRQMYARIKQFWNTETWIRVTDDQDNLRWVGLNGQVTAQEWMEEIINDKSESLVKRKQAAMAFAHLMQMKDSENLEEAAQAEEILGRIVTVRNETSDLDVDIILDQSFDSVNIQQEQFEILAKFAQGTEVDIIQLIELSQLRNKKELIEKIEKRREDMAEAQQSANNPANDPVLMQKTAQVQIEAQKAEQDMKIKQADTMNSIELERTKAAAQMEIEREKAAMQMEIEKQKAAAQIIMNREKMMLDDDRKKVQSEMDMCKEMKKEEPKEDKSDASSQAISELSSAIREIGMAFAGKPAPVKTIDIQTDKAGNITGGTVVG